MAKLETLLMGDFDIVLEALNECVLKKSSSATLEDSSDFTLNQSRCSVRVYERYSYTGQNRVSLSLTLFSNGEDELLLSAISAGGSQGVLFKLNTFGESAFLETIEEVVRKYEKK